MATGYDGLGHTGANDELHECDRCYCTLMCDPAHLDKWGWKRRTGRSHGVAWALVLCDECEAKTAAAAA